MADRPVRIQLCRTKGWRMPANTLKVDRRTKWGNPAIPGRTFMGLPVADKRHAAILFASFAPDNERLASAARSELCGKNLACWCALCDLHRDGKPVGSNCPDCDKCHADTLLELANAEQAHG